MRVLLIKMSSLGDVVHALVPVTDAARAVPNLCLDWVVEEAYCDIPKWHPSVRRVIVSPLRRWRKSPVAALRHGEWARFREDLRQERYDLVLDAQGLLKSAFIGLQARGPVTGRDTRSAREAAAALLYQRRCKVDLALTEVEQLRQLFAFALRYAPPATPADFGLHSSLFKPPAGAAYLVFLHGAAWPSKLWPEENWIELARQVRNSGYRVLLPWGTETEHVRATRIAGAAGAEVLDRLNISSLASVLAGASCAIGLDTGLTHIAVALGVPTITLYGPSVPVYDKIARGKLINLRSSDSSQVDTSRPNCVSLTNVVGAFRQICSHAAPVTP